MGYAKLMVKALLETAFNIIRDEVGDAKEGLGHDVFHFVSSLTPIVNVDLLIKNKKQETLLTWREDEFYGPGWHLPGGVVRFKEDPETRIRQVALTELGCIVNFSKVPLTVRSQITNDRNVRGHFLSLLYSCSLETQPALELKATNASPQNGQWEWHIIAPQNLVSVHDSFRVYIDGNIN